MKNTLKAFAILLVSVLTVGSCKKPPDTPPETPTPKEAVPSITRATPAQVEAGSLLTITGANLSNVTKIYFGITSVSPKTKSVSELSVEVPVLAEGSHTMSVESPAGRSNNLDITIVIPKPARIEGNNLVVLSGYEFTFTGSNMQGVTGVNFHGQLVKPKSVTETSVVVEIPDTGHAEKTWWKIHMEGKGGNSNTVDLEMIPGPKVTKRIPNEPYAGMPLIIQGKNLKWAYSVGFSGEWVEKEDFRKHTNDEIIIDVPKTINTGKKKFALHAANGKDVQETEINVASLANDGGVNPGNISVNPGNLGSIGTFSDDCGSYYNFVYIKGSLITMFGGRGSLGAHCPGNSNFTKTIDSKRYRTYRSSPLEIGYEIQESGGFTGAVYLANYTTEGEFTITHWGKILDKSTFDSNKFSSVSLMISLEDGSLSRICSPRTYWQWASSLGDMDQNGYFNSWGSPDLIAKAILQNCSTCKECQ